jgi:hypothetical protein
MRTVAVHRQAVPQVGRGGQVLEPGVGDEHHVGVRRAGERGGHPARPRRQQVRMRSAAAACGSIPFIRSRSIARRGGPR